MRNYKIDTIKAILVYLVVLGHILELLYMDNEIAKRLYLIIYVFHIPVFVFTTGYFAKHNIKKMMMNIMYPYLLFSVLYQLCAVFWWKNAKSFSFVTPYWLLWYLFAVFVWSLTIPLWEGIKGKWQGVFLIACVIIGCLAGYCSGIGRVFTLSRIIVFFPFFVLGKYWYQYEEKYVSKKIRNYVYDIILLLVMVTTCVFYIYQPKIRRTWLYEATPYTVSHYHAGIRLLHLVIGCLCVFIAMRLIPEKPIKYLSETGKHTMVIYLLHGFIIKTLAYFDVANYLGIVDKKATAVMLCALTAVAIVFILSSKPVVKVTSFVLAPWHICGKTQKG